MQTQTDLKHLPNCIIYCVATVLLLPSAVRANYLPYPGGMFAVHLIAKKKDYRLGESIALHVSVENQSNETVRVFWSPRPSCFQCVYWIAAASCC